MQEEIKQGRCHDRITEHVRTNKSLVPATATISLASGIRVNAIGPGPTVKMDSQSEDHFLNQRHNTILRRGFNSQDIDIVEVLNYFIDSPSVTGQLICTDGGQHLIWNPKFRGEDY